jgi:hypothetical protein
MDAVKLSQSYLGFHSNTVIWKSIFVILCLRDDSSKLLVLMKFVSFKLFIQWAYIDKFCTEKYLEII